MIKIYSYSVLKNHNLYFATIDDSVVIYGNNCYKTNLLKINNAILNKNYHLGGDYTGGLKNTNLIAEFENIEDFKENYNFKLAEYLI